MGEYIERGAIKYELWSVGPLNEPLMVVRKKTVDAIPAADVVEVKHGRWELVTTKYFPGQTVRVGYCQNCNEERPVDNYCPNCGAKMDLEE